MELLGVILILIVWAIIALKEKLTPPNPPIDDMSEHLKQLCLCRIKKQGRNI